MTHSDDDVDSLAAHLEISDRDDITEKAMSELNSHLNTSDAEAGVQEMKSLNESFHESGVMTDYVEETTKKTGDELRVAVEAGFGYLKQIENSEKAVEADAIHSWISSTQLTIVNLNSVEELSQINDQIQLYANKMGSDENLQDQLLSLGNLV